MVLLLERLRQVEEKYEALERQLADPEVAGNWQEYNRLAKERADLEPVVEKFRTYARLKEEEEENRRLLNDPDADLRALAQEELAATGKRLEALEEELRILLLPRDPNDDKNIFLEIRAGTGGEEAALFAADLFRMYAKYAEDRRWKVEILSANPGNRRAAALREVLIQAGSAAALQAADAGPRPGAKQSLLYYRIPLVNPDAFFTRLEPLLRFAWTPAFLGA